MLNRAALQVAGLRVQSHGATNSAIRLLAVRSFHFTIGGEPEQRVRDKPHQFNSLRVAPEATGQGFAVASVTGTPKTSGTAEPVMEPNPSAIEFYYAHQAQARGLLTTGDVRALSGDVDRIYDSLVLHHLPPEKDVPIYEVACGPGLVLSWLQRRGYTNTLGSDMSADYVRLATDLGVKATLADSIADLRNKPDASLAVVFAIDFIEHLPKDVFVTFLREVVRVLRPGGRLILRAPNADSPLVGRNLFNDITHQWAYTSVALEALCRVVGFTSVLVIDEADAPPRRGRWLSPAVWLARRFLHGVWALATRERIRFWSPNYFAVVSR